MVRGTRGFAVLELLIVVGVGSIVLGSLIWQVRPLADRLALRAAASRLVEDLRDAQARALAARDAGRAYGAEFPADGSGYLVFAQTGDARQVLREQTLHPRVRITYTLPYRFGGQ